MQGQSHCWSQAGRWALGLCSPGQGAAGGSSCDGVCCRAELALCSDPGVTVSPPLLQMNTGPHLSQAASLLPAAAWILWYSRPGSGFVQLFGAGVSVLLPGGSYQAVLGAGAGCVWVVLASRVSGPDSPCCLLQLSTLPKLHWAGVFWVFWFFSPWQHPPGAVAKVTQGLTLPCEELSPGNARDLGS